MFKLLNLRVFKVFKNTGNVYGVQEHLKCSRCERVLTML